MAWSKQERGKLGSSKSTEWNNNLMWRLFVESESKQMHLNPSQTSIVSDYHDLPPHMRSVQKAIQRSEVGKALLQHNRDVRVQAAKELRDSYKPDQIPKPAIGGLRKLSNASSTASSSLAPSARSSRSGFSARPQLAAVDEGYDSVDAATSGLPTPSPVITSRPPPTPSLGEGGFGAESGRLSDLEHRLRLLEERQRIDEERIRSRDRKLAAYQEALSTLVEAVDRAKERKQ